MGNFMELVHKDGDISEMEIKEVCSWCHVCAERQEVAPCGKGKARRKTGTGDSACDSKEEMDGTH